MFRLQTWIYLIIILSVTACGGDDTEVYQLNADDSETLVTRHDHQFLDFHTSVIDDATVSEIIDAGEVVDSLAVFADYISTSGVQPRRNMSTRDHLAHDIYYTYIPYVDVNGMLDGILVQAVHGNVSMIRYLRERAIIDLCSSQLDQVTSMLLLSKLHQYQVLIDGFLSSNKAVAAALSEVSVPMTDTTLIPRVPQLIVWYQWGIARDGSRVQGQYLGTSVEPCSAGGGGSPFVPVNWGTGIPGLDPDDWDEEDEESAWGSGNTGSNATGPSVDEVRELVDEEDRDCYDYAMDFVTKIALDQIVSGKIISPCDGIYDPEELVQELVHDLCSQSSFGTSQGGGNSYDDVGSINLDDFTDLLSSRGISKEFSDAVRSLMESDLNDPCDPDRSVADMVGEALANAEDCSLEGFEVAWDGMDKIIPDQSFLDCSIYNCLYNRYKEEKADFWCDNLDDIFNSEVFDLHLTTHSVGADGSVDFDNIIEGTFEMSFHSSDCNSVGDQLSIAATFLHESVHAKWKYDLFVAGIPSNDYQTRKEYWLNFIVAEYGVAYNSEHEAMAAEFVEIIARELHELNGGQLSIDHYKYYLYAGLEDDLKQLFGQQTIDQWKDLHDELNGVEEGSINYNTFVACD